MKRIGLVAISLAGSIQIGAAQSPEPSTRADSAELVLLTRELGAAMIRRNGAMLDRLLMPDFTAVSPRGRLMSKDMYVRGRTTGSVTFQTVQYDDIIVRVYGSSAVITSRYTTAAQAKDSLASGAAGGGDQIMVGTSQDIGGEYARTETWIKRDGQWRAASMQLSPVAFAGAHEATATTALREINEPQLAWVASPDYPGAHIAVLSGAPYSGPYVIRLRRGDGHVIQPHQHESDEYVTVLSGRLHVGVGDRIDRSSAKTIRSGGFVLIPAHTRHFSWAEGDLMEEIHWSGPAAPVYVKARPNQ